MVEDKLVKNFKLLSGSTQTRFQDQGVAIAELTSIGKSNTGFLREVRNALAEYSEEHRSNLAVVKATQSVVESMAEQRAEILDSLQKMRDMMARTEGAPSKDRPTVQTSAHADREGMAGKLQRCSNQH